MHEKFMKNAVELAQNGITKTNPNPPVGAVIVKNGQIVGQGFHEKAGFDHAEVIAINQAGKNAQGADLYVTLEPCSTAGRKPPCTNKIITSGIKRVFVGSLDPNEKNCNKCKDVLRQHGIDFTVGILKEETDILIEPFSKFITQKRPFFSMKAAISLDGRIASSSGDSKWITNEKSRKFVHELRNRSDAIIIGKNTAVMDNPHLNVRGIENPNKPYKIILGYDEKITLNNNIFKTDKDKVIFFIKKGSNLKPPAGIVHEITNIKDITTILYKMDIMNVLVEGGAKTFKSFLEAKIIDKCYFFISPRIIGGNKLCVPTDFIAGNNISESLLLNKTKIQAFDEDVLVEGYV